MSKLVLISVLIALAFVFYYVYVSTRNFEFKMDISNIVPRNVDKILSGGASIDLTLILSLTNPSIFSFDIRNIKVKMFYAGKLIASTPVAIEKISIRPNQTVDNSAVLNIPANMELIDIAAKYVRKEQFTIDYEVDYNLFIFSLFNKGVYYNLENNG